MAETYGESENITQRAVKATARQTSRVWLMAALLAIGLWLVQDDPVHLWAYRKIPAAVGAWGLASWAIRTTMFRDRAQSTEWPGALINTAIIVGAALVIAAVM